MILVSASQPLWFPPIFMFERFARIHKLIFLVEAQWRRSAGHTEAFIKSNNGNNIRLNLPVLGKGRKPIWEIALSDDTNRWKQARERLYTSYKKASCLPEAMALYDQVIEEITDATSLNAAEASIISTRATIRALRLGTSLTRSVDLVGERPAEPTDWMCQLAKHSGATDYLQGENAIRGYFKPGVFRQAGIKVWAQQFTIDRYCQLGSFNPGISILDAVAHLGLDRTRQLLAADIAPGLVTASMRRMPEFE